MEFSIVTQFEPDHIARELSDQLTIDELIEFIQALDLYVADWDFTEALYKWVKKEHKEFKAEKKKDSW